MSVSSNSRKESTDSYASQQMQNGGDLPGTDQLHRFNQPDNRQVTTERIQSDDTDFSDDFAEIDDSVTDDESSVRTQTDNSVTGYQTGAASMGGDGYNQTQPAGTHVEDADWNTTTEDDGMAPTRTDEPDRAYGNS
ncbi:hypothetical protein [Rudanella lutea]|uniref:hypothetical protein n=1 Tax=Rudanella lutea TaxID=451374 RepID=UPI000370B3D4|nr:hypothetical protein [Rudanella lutea]